MARRLLFGALAARGLTFARAMTQLASASRARDRDSGDRGLSKQRSMAQATSSLVLCFRLPRLRTIALFRSTDTKNSTPTWYTARITARNPSIQPSPLSRKKYIRKGARYRTSWQRALSLGPDQGPGTRPGDGESGHVARSQGGWVLGCVRESKPPPSVASLFQMVKPE